MSKTTWLNHAVQSFQVDITPELTSSGPDLSGEDLAYFAGLFDGEGCVGISQHRSKARHYRYSLFASIHMGDREALDALQAKWGGCIVGSRDKRPGHRPTFLWRLEHAAAVPFLEAIFPYLRLSRVRTKVRLGLEFQAQKGRPGGGPRHLLDIYRRHQREYYERMRELNRRGPKEPSHA